jgi:hypothetical protein
MTAPVFQQPAAGHVRPPVTGLAGQITAHVLDTVHHATTHAPRSLQRAPGPSEIGTPCTRKLGYKILGADQPNGDRDQWLPTIGTAVHAWMAEVYEAENRRLGRERYLIERRVHLPAGISGSSDLFDRDTGVNNDWKVSGLDRIKKYRRDGPGDQYEVQAHLYGLGMLLAGEDVTDVAITFLPRGGLLTTGIYVWTEPFDAARAVAAIERYEKWRTAVWALDPEAHPERWEAFPTADDNCSFCPFHLPFSTDLGKGCPGHKSARK